MASQHSQTNAAIEQTSAGQPVQRGADPEQPNPPLSGHGSSAIDDTSAARPAPQLDASEEMHGLQECNDWLNDLPPQEIAQSKPLLQLQLATILLLRGSCRQQRQDLQQLFGAWGVPQKARGSK